MAFDLKSITDGIVKRPPRIILLGGEKSGKSTWAAGSESPVFIPMKLEKGIDELKIPKFPVVSSHDDLMEALGNLAQGDHKFKTVVIDSASAYEPIVWSTVCSEGNVSTIAEVGGGYGQGYLKALYKWQEMMEALDYLREEQDMASIIIGHTRVKRFDDPERESYDRYEFDVKENIASALYRWADFIGFANTSVAVESEKVGFNKSKKRGVQTDEGKRYLYTQKRPAHPGGGRGDYGKLDYEIPLEYSEFKKAVAELTKKKK